MITSGITPENGVCTVKVQLSDVPPQQTQDMIEVSITRQSGGVGYGLYKEFFKILPSILKTSKLPLYHGDVPMEVHISPWGTKTSDSLMLAIVAGFGKFAKPQGKICYIGAIDVEGNILPVKQLPKLINLAISHGFKHIVVPKTQSNLCAMYQGDVLFYGLEHCHELTQLKKHLVNTTVCELAPAFNYVEEYSPCISTWLGDFEIPAIVGACLAGHLPLLLFGAKGEGKSHLLQTIHGVEADYSMNTVRTLTEMYASTHEVLKPINKVNTPLLSAAVSTSTTMVGLLGGVNPGTISKHPVVLIDEFLEVSGRKFISSLLTETESDTVMVSRAKQTNIYPNLAMVVGAGNLDARGMVGTGTWKTVKSKNAGTVFLPDEKKHWIDKQRVSFLSEGRVADRFVKLFIAPRCNDKNFPVPSTTFSQLITQLRDLQLSEFGKELGKIREPQFYDRFNLVGDSEFLFTMNKSYLNLYMGDDAVVIYNSVKPYFNKTMWSNFRLKRNTLRLAWCLQRIYALLLNFPLPNTEEIDNVFIEKALFFYTQGSLHSCTTPM